MTKPLVKIAQILNVHDWEAAGEAQNISAALEADGLAWVHLDGTHPDAPQWIEHELSYLDLQAREALLDIDTRPRASELGDGLIVILRGINFNEGESPEDMVSIRMYIDAKRIVTIARKRVVAIERMQRSMDLGQGPVDAGQFLVFLIEDLVSNIGIFQRDLDLEADALESEVVTENHRDLRHEVSDLRLKVIAARRYIGPLRDALRSISEARASFVDSETRREVEEESLKMTRIAEDMDELRDQAMVLREELSGQLSDRVNQNTFVLSVLSAIFLPLGFLTGLFGVNLAGMPGTENNHAFWMLVYACIVILIALAILVGAFRFARRKK